MSVRSIVRVLLQYALILLLSGIAASVLSGCQFLRPTLPPNCPPELPTLPPSLDGRTVILSARDVENLLIYLDQTDQCFVSAR